MQAIDGAGATAIAAAREFQPQVCLLDFDMPGGGILAADRISLELPSARIALMSGTPRHDQLRDAILAATARFLPAATSPDRLSAALNGLMNGEAALPRAMTGQLVREFRQLAPRTADGRALLPGAGSDGQPLPPRSRVWYLPRLMRHYRRRRRSGMSVATSWASARARMTDY